MSLTICEVTAAILLVVDQKLKAIRDAVDEARTGQVEEAKAA
jgi:hypothetical protein